MSRRNPPDAVAAKNAEQSMTPQPTDLVIFAVAKAKPGSEQALLDALMEAAAPTRAQPGCVDFTLYRAAGNPGTITAVERWASPTHHDRHLQGAHVARLMEAMGTLLAEPPSITPYVVVDEAS
jgi:quinol monooxygenase YgiN